MFKFDSAPGYFIHLMSCMFHSTKPKEKPENVLFEEVYKLSNKQLFTNVTFCGIQQVENKPDDKLYEKWQSNYAYNLARCANQMFELDIMIDAFISQGYDVMPLKGSVIKKYYPNPDMRPMSDIDLLVKSNDRDAVRKIMYACGYEMFIPDDGQVDTFKKGNMIYVDLHYSLMAENHHGQEHFQDTWDIAVETNKKGVYAFAFEDLYVYNIGHYAKHMFSSGTGMRCIADVYVLWNAASDYQKQIINEKLKSKELYTFNEKLVKISGIWFDGDEDDGTLCDVQEYFMNTSTYGNEDSVDAIKLVTSNGEEISKAQYYKKRLFPDADYLYSRYNVKHKSKVLLPFLWIRRMFGVLFKINNVTNEVSKTQNVSKEDLENSKSLYSKLGLLDNDM